MTQKPGRAVADLVSRFAAVGALIWLAGSLTAAGFYAILPGTTWDDASLPFGARLGLLGSELYHLAYAALLVAIPIFLLLGRTVPRDRMSGLTRRLAVGSSVTILWITSLAYLASWLAFRSTGHFLGPATLRLSWANRVQVLQHGVHMEPWTPVVAVLGAVAFASTLTLALSRGGWLRRAAPRRALWIAALFLFAVSSILAARVPGMVPGGLFQARYSQTTGPLNHFITELGFRLDARGDPAFRDAKPVVERRPIVSLEEYLRSVRAGPGRPADVRHARGRPPSVLVVVIESLRPDQLRSFSGPRSVMPTIDSLAAQGRRYLRHYTQASHSDYADPALFSSHYPLRSPVYHIYPEEVPYPRVLVYDILAALGYSVGIFSSQNESWSGMKHYLHTPAVDTFLHSETYAGPTYVPERDRAFAAWATGGRKSGKIDDRFTVGEALRWIEETEGPFFIYMNLQNSHVPYEVPADFDPPFGTGRVSFPIRFGDFPRDSVQAVKDLYANSLAYVDSQLARLIRFLGAAGRLEETILVLTGDTGQAFYEHGFTSHASAVYDEVMRVPLVIRAPGLEPGVDTRLSEHIDVAPTILDLLGLPPHPSFQGTTLLAAGRGAELEKAVFLVGQALVKQYAIVRDRWKLIYDARRRGYELYDLEADPGELDDLAGTHAHIVRELARPLHAWQKVQLDYYAAPTSYERWYPPRLIGVAPAGVSRTGEGAGSSP